MSDSNKPAEGSGAKVSSAGPLLVVDIGKRQKKKEIKNLRKGHGKLFDKVADLLAELKGNGTVNGEVQPLVIVVREKERRMLGW
jgi:hypothetical protein